jgi:hypothetical protein
VLVLAIQEMPSRSTGVLPDCYTGHCACDFLESLSGTMRVSVLETAVCTEGDGVATSQKSKRKRQPYVTIPCKQCVREPVG